jgi:hypothetical protein
LSAGTATEDKSIAQKGVPKFADANQKELLTVDIKQVPEARKSTQPGSANTAVQKK